MGRTFLCGSVSSGSEELRALQLLQSHQQHFQLLVGQAECGGDTAANRLARGDQSPGLVTPPGLVTLSTPSWGGCSQ